MNNPQPWWLTWPVAEVAAAILPLLSASTSERELVAIDNILAWCWTGSYGKRQQIRIVNPGKVFGDPDARAIAEAIQLLEHAALVMRTAGGVDAAETIVGLTRLGMQALQTNTVRQHLGLGDAPSTA
jgi:hypothetical protein